MVKELNPITVADFAIANRYHKEPKLRWWLHKVIKKQDRIITIFKSRFKKANKNMFGLEVPTTVEESLVIYKREENTLWQDSINE